jgi:hypothetical protein
MLTKLQAEVVDRIDPTARWEEDLHCGLPVICKVTGKYPTYIEDMTDDQCREVLARMDEQAKELKLRESLRGTRWAKILF